jgi:hypothetical protein
VTDHVIVLAKFDLSHWHVDLERALGQLGSLGWEILEVEKTDLHIIEFGPIGWTLKHPLVCRPKLFECPVNQAVQREAAELSTAPLPPGRYHVVLDENGMVVVGSKLENAG